jgi:thiol-disulfide isomerase/thioredoxin
MKLFRPFSAILAVAIAAPGFCLAQEKKEEPKSVPATKVKAKEAEEKKDDEKKEEKEDEDDAPKLDIGSKAPTLAITDWVKGDKIEKFQDGQVYVVEFWATWCGPCKMSMPHLAELQTKYGDKVKMIGISDEDTSKVTKFLKQEQSEDKTWDQVVTYALAMDDERKTSGEYMEAAGEQGIPTAFIVGKDGVIDWIGHPMSMDKPLEDIVNGKYDRTVAKAERVEAKKAQIAMMKASQKIQKALAAGKTDEAVKVIDELVEANPKMGAQLGFAKLQILAQGDEKEAAEKYAAELVDKLGDNSQMLNALAWGIAADQNLPGTLDTALKAAQKAVKVTEEKDGMVIDTLARVYFEQGKIDDAITWQKKAVELNKDPQITEALEKYEAAKKEGGKKEDKEEKKEKKEDK